jgi:D-beta-D-heptose 7-phosphate kinase/D-beta-D-heptose 1-phosphate adenosyltransferase
VVDARRPAAYRGAGLTACKPNFGEVSALLDLQAGGDRAAAVAAQGRRLLDLCGAEVVAVTLDAEGALVFERGRPPYRTFARPQPGSRATGAGDTFTVALALGLAVGGDVPAAAELASAAAEVVVDQAGTAACAAHELRRRLGGSGKIVPSVAELATRRESLRAGGRRLVLTSGCFDILHRGHVTYLNRAKELGDVLVVAVNDDAGVRRLKGAERPVNPLEDRLGVLAGLSSVDVLVPFGDDTPVAVVRALAPDVFVKGGDYTRETLPEGAEVERLGGAVRIVPLVDDRSTSALIERIRAPAG